MRAGHDDDEQPGDRDTERHAAEAVGVAGGPRPDPTCWVRVALLTSVSSHVVHQEHVVDHVRVRVLRRRGPAQERLQGGRDGVDQDREHDDRGARRDVLPVRDAPGPTTLTTTPITLASVIVRLNDRANSCAIATGTIISALTSSRPTTRIAMVTVSAAMVATSIDSSRTGSPLARANSSSWLTANRAVPQADADAEHEDRERDGPPQVGGGHGRDRAEQVADEVGVGAAGDLDEQDAAGDAAVEHEREGEVAAGPAALAHQLDDDRRRRPRRRRRRAARACPAGPGPPSCRRASRARRR